MTESFDPIKLRETAGYTRADIATETGFDHSTVCRWERSPESMKRIIKNFYLSLEPKVEVAEWPPPNTPAIIVALRPVFVGIAFVGIDAPAKLFRPYQTPKLKPNLGYKVDVTWS